jgi:DNA-binding MarR family transcriptional regulator
MQSSVKRAADPASAAPRRAGDNVGYLMKRLGSALRQQFDETLRREGLSLSSAHVGALFALEEDSDATGATIARHVMVTAQAMNTVLRKLETAGLAARTVQPHNRRADSWNITNAGRRQLARVRQSGEPVFARMMAPLTPTERKQFRRMLEQCASALEAASRR